MNTSCQNYNQCEQDDFMVCACRQKQSKKQKQPLHIERAWDLPFEGEDFESFIHGSEIGLSRLVERVFDGMVRYDQSIKEWRIYEDGIWQSDNNRKFRRMLEDVIKILCIRGSKLLNDKAVDLSRDEDPDAFEDQHKAFKKLASKMGNVQSVDNINKNISFYFSCSAGDFDLEKQLICLTNGVFDFDASNLLGLSPDFMFTKRLGFAYDPEAKCPRWEEFLKLILRDNQEVIQYLQKIFGYCLTGHNSLQSLFFLYGGGANGKSMVINILKHLLGEQNGGYFFQFKAEQLLGKNRNSNPRDNEYLLASFPGKRVICGSEVPDNMIFDTATIKDITGGDTIYARNPHGRPFNFEPTFKVLLYGNHKPKIRETDTGIRRRIKLIQFDYSFETEGAHLKRDSEEVLAEFVAELPGIFNWAIEGYKLYVTEKLKEPEAVREATQQYIDDQDTIKQFIDDCCEIGTTLKAKASDLWKAFGSWCDETGQRRGISKHDFYKEVEKNYQSTVTNGKQKYFVGIAMADDNETSLFDSKKQAKATKTEEPPVFPADNQAPPDWEGPF